MKNWKCYNCGCEFSEPKEEYTSYEAFYGVASEFSSSTPMEINVCPVCNSERIEIIDTKETFEYDEEEEDE